MTTKPMQRTTKIFLVGLSLMCVGVILRMVGSLDVGALLLGAGAAVAAMHDPYTRVEGQDE